MKIIFDTNILIYIVKFKVDIKPLGGELYTLETVIDELKKLSKRRSKDGVAARVALEIAKNLKILPKSTKGNTDKLLLYYGKKGYVIATQDSKLRKKLEKNGCKTIYLRQKKYFEGIE